MNVTSSGEVTALIAKFVGVRVALIDLLPEIEGFQEHDAE